MPRTAVSLGALVCLVVPVASQVTATATVREACTQPAPPGSLTARALAPITYLPDAGDVVVMECESAGSPGSWVEETVCGGFGGASYLRWNGPDLFFSPGRDPLTYRFRVNPPGEYLVRVHIRHDNPDPSEGNDCWASMDAEPWEKLFHNTGAGGVGVWTFNPRYEHTGDFPRYTLAQGVHEFRISGRSRNFKIDRVHVLPVPTWFAQLGDAESQVERERPLLGGSFAVIVDDPTGAAGMTPGQTITQVYGGLPAPGYPCGVPSPFGEFLLDLGVPVVKNGCPIVWDGTNGNVHQNSIPNDSSLLGAQLSLQGVLYEPATRRIVLTNALDLRVGNQ